MSIMNALSKTGKGIVMFGKGIALGAAIAVVLAIIALPFFRIIWVTMIDNYEYGFTFNKFTGEIQHVERTGYIVRNPFKYSVHRIDLRPYQITISANARVLNAKLVRVQP
jgi:hypothetical protein